MTCRHCEGAGSVFNRRAAARQLKRLRRRGADRTTQVLIDQLRAAGVEGLTLLDIGGGVGAVSLALVEAGVTSARGVDAAPAYVSVATAEVERRGLADRIRHRTGDFVDDAADTAPAGVVTLDRVICCYPAMERLVESSAAKARRLYGIVMPRDDWWVRMGSRFPNAYFRLTGNAFRVFVHPLQAVERVLLAEGLRRRFRQRTALWQVLVYERP